MKFKITILSVIFVLCGSAFSLQMSDTPIQNQLKYNLIFAADDFTEDFGTADEESPLSENNEVVRTEKVSVAKSALYSALLPGLGEYKLGKKGKAKFFFSAETVGWISFAAFRIYGNWKEDDMIEYAAEYAGAQLDGKDDTFEDMVGFYDSRDDYNSLGRVSDPDRPYYPDSPVYNWQWQSADAQANYRDLKNKSRDAFKKSDLVLTLLVVNRIVSVIDVVRDAVRINKKVDSIVEKEKENNFKFTVNPFSDKNMVKVTFYPSF